MFSDGTNSFDEVCEFLRRNIETDVGCSCPIFTIFAPYAHFPDLAQKMRESLSDCVARFETVSLPSVGVTQEEGYRYASALKVRLEGRVKECPEGWDMLFFDLRGAKGELISGFEYVSAALNAAKDAFCVGGKNLALCVILPPGKVPQFRKSCEDFFSVRTASFGVSDPFPDKGFSVGLEP